MASARAEPGTNVLVLAPSLSSEKESRCLDSLAIASADQLDVLKVSYSKGADEIVSAWRDHHGELPARLGVVRVGDSASLRGVEPDAADLDAVALTSANPNDVTGLGMRLNNYVNDHPDDAQLAVCFDSLTQMLQFTDVQSVFKFVHMFTGQLREVGAVAHFHLDPSAHDPQTISRLKPAFDDAVEIE
jgi:hypothetical protein